MKKETSNILLAIATVLLLATFAFADITFENQNYKVTISDNAQFTSVFDKASKRELCPAKNNVPFALLEDKFPADKMTVKDRNIQFSFKGTDTVITYAAVPAENWIVFRLTNIQGKRPKSIVLCQVPIAITKNVGRLLDITYDDKTSVCLMAANMQTNGRATTKKAYTLLQATSQDSPGPALEGAAAALVIAKTENIRKILRDASQTFNLLTNEDVNGIPSKESMGRLSYWFFNVKESDADGIIALCKKTNIKQFMMGFGSWAKTAGHIEYNTKNFPDGAASLKRFAKKLNDAGIGCGSHSFVSKISKKDSYVTPIPNKQFWVDKQTTLAADISADAKSIKVTSSIKEWAGSPIASQKRWEGGVKKHQDVIIGDEIIQYKSIDPKTNTFIGCTRGAYGTHKAAHKKTDPALHWGVDGCINGYIIDPDSQLMDEVAQRMADVFNECGFNMIYFDGSEDVPRTRYDYYSTIAHAKTVEKIRTRPLMHLGGGRTHRLWHSFTFGATVDTYLNTISGRIISGEKVEKLPTVRKHIDRSVRAVIAAKKSLMSGELGWFGIWPKTTRYGHEVDGLQLDELEYLMVKSLAYDAPISLEVGFATMEKHPLCPEILNIVGIYENLRMNRLVDDKTLGKLKSLGKDFSRITIGDKTEFVKMKVIPSVANTHDIRALVGTLADGSTVINTWHYTGESHTVQIPAENLEVAAYDLYGKKIPLDVTDQMINIPVSAARLTLVLKNITVAEILENADAVTSLN
jgi:hypothetical protein